MSLYLTAERRHGLELVNADAEESITQLVTAATSSNAQDSDVSIGFRFVPRSDDPGSDYPVLSVARNGNVYAGGSFYAGGASALDATPRADGSAAPWTVVNGEYAVLREDLSRVGIGVSDPTHALEVAGPVKATSFQGSVPYAHLTQVPSAAEGVAGVVRLTSSATDARSNVAASAAKSDEARARATERVARAGDAMTGTLRMRNGADVVVESGGKVGIGSGSAPAYALDVQGDVNFTGALLRDGAQYPPPSPWTLGTHAVTGDAVVHTDARVGVGTADPDAELEVVGTVVADAFAGDGSALTGLNANNVASGALVSGRGGTGRTSLDAGRLLVGADQAAVATPADLFWESGARRLGVRTSNPAEALHVADGDARVDGGVRIGSAYATDAAGSASNCPFGWSNTGAFLADPNELGLAAGGVEQMRITPSEVVFRGGTQLNASTFLGASNDVPSAPSFAWAGQTDTGVFLAAPGAVGVSAAGSEAVRVAADGRVGIGSSAPAHRLHVGGHVRADDAFLAPSSAETTAAAPGYAFAGDEDTGLHNVAQDALALVTAGAEALRATAAGNLGAGVALPRSRIHVRGALTLEGASNAAEAGRVLADPSGGDAAAPSYSWEGTNAGLFYDAASGAVALSAGAAPRLRVQDATGYVRVDGGGGGGGAAAERLHVADGKLRVDDQIVAAGDGGTATAPAYAWAGDGSNTGLYRTAAGTLAVSVAGAARALFQADGRTGIGVSPSGPGAAAPLHVIGETLVEGGPVRAAGGVLAPVAGAYSNAASPGYAFSGDADTGMYRPGSNVVCLAAGGDEVLRASSGGVVEVSSLRAGARFEGAAADAASAPSFTWTADSNTGWFRPAQGEVALANAGAETWRATSGGAIGVGTAAPAERLDVAGGNVRSRGAFLAADGGLSSPAFSFFQESNAGIFRDAAEDTLVVAKGGAGALRVSSAGTLGVAGTPAADATTSVLDVYGVARARGSGVAWLAPTGDSAAAPGFAWDDGGARDAGMFRPAARTLAWSTSNVERARISADGAVGIGTAAPAHRLHVAGGDAHVEAGGRFTAGGRGSAAEPTFGWADGIAPGVGAFLSGADDALAFATGAQERVHIASDGSLGVGTAAPGAKLHVAGGDVLVDADLRAVGSVHVEASGTASAPALGWDAVGTGLHLPQSNVLALAADGSDVLRAGSGVDGVRVIAGDVRAPAGRVYASAAAAENAAYAPSFSWEGAEGNGMYLAGGDSDVALSTQGAERVRVSHATGFVGVNAAGTPASEALDVFGNVRARASVFAADGSAAAPALGFASERTTGAFREDGAAAGSSRLGLSAQGEAGVYVASDGSVGLGGEIPPGDRAVTGVAVHARGDVKIVEGAVLARNADSAASPGYAWAADPDTGMFRAGSNALGLATAGAQRVHVAADGRVGVGTAAPAAALHVVGDLLTQGGSVVADGRGTSADPAFTWSSNAAATAVGAFLTAPDDTLAFGVAGAEVMRLQPNGRVGIGGVTAPADALHVGNGGVYAAGGDVVAAGDVLCGASARLAWSGDADTYFERASADEVALTCGGARAMEWRSNQVLVAADAGVRLSPEDSNAVPAFVGRAGDQAVAPSFAWDGDADTGLFRPADDALAAATGGQERLRVDAAGRVGVGLTTPGAALDVSGDVRARAGFLAADADGYAFATDGGAGLRKAGQEVRLVAAAAGGSNVAGVRLAEDGTLGLGNAVAPSGAASGVAADVGGGGLRLAQAGAQFLGPGSNGTSSSTSNAPTYAWDDDRDTGAFLAAGDTWALATGGIERLRVTAAGRLGVGTEAPAHALHVGSGDARVEGAVLADAGTAAAPAFAWVGGDAGVFLSDPDRAVAVATAGAERARFAQDGNVGIGTPAPSVRLHVGNGDLRVDGNARVESNVYATAGSAASPAFSWIGDADTGVFRPGADEVAVAVGGAERLRVSAAGVHVTGGALTTADGRFAGDSNDGPAAPSFTWSGDEDTGVYHDGLHRVAIATAGARRVLVSEAGYVGIGVGVGSAPAEMLDVDGKARVRDALLASDGAPAAPGYAFAADEGAGVFRPGGGDSGVAVATEGAERLRVTRLAGGGGGAALGVGLTSPAEAVHAAGNVLAEGDLRARDRALVGAGSAGAPSFSFRDDEDTGVYSSAADALAVVCGGVEKLRANATGPVVAPALDVNAGQLSASDGTSNAPGLAWIADPDTGVYRPAADAVAVCTQGSERLRVDASGRLAVGLELPTAAVDVAGPVRARAAFLASDGAADAPGFSFASDSNTGMFRLGNGTLAWSISGAEVLRVSDQGGKVGVGVANPADQLHVGGGVRVEGDLAARQRVVAAASVATSNAPSFTWDADDDTGMYRAEEDHIGFAAAGVEQVRITPQGLEVRGGFGSTGQLRGFDGDTELAPYYTWQGDLDTGVFRPAADTVAVSTAGVERWRTTAAGDVGIGLTTPEAALHVNGDAITEGSLTQRSDARVKTNVRTLTGALDKVGALRGCVFARTDRPGRAGRDQVGLLAQEVQPVVPEAVHHDARRDTYALAYGDLVGVLVEAVKELRAETREQARAHAETVSGLQRRVQALEIAHANAQVAFVEG